MKWHCNGNPRPFVFWFEYLFSKYTCKIKMYLRRQIWASEASVSLPRTLIFLVRSIFVPVNDVYCNRIITVNLSLSHLLDCLSFSLSLCHFLINRDIVQVVHRMQELGCFCQKTAFCTPHAQGPRKSYTQRGRGGNTPTHIHSLIARWQTDSPHCLSVTFNPLFLERRKRSGSMICDITSHCRL